MKCLVRRWLVGFGLAMIALLVVGCASRSLNRAPVEERPVGSTADAGQAAVVSGVKQPPGFQNAGKPGYYTVKPGDNLLRISLEHGQTIQDIALWSHIDNPNRIEVGQVLRVMPPVSSEVVVRPVAKPVVVSGSASQPTPATAPGNASTASAVAVTAAKPAVGEGDINWIWPATGAVLAGFDEVKNKGLDIGGKVGEPVVAAADGRVVYVGAGLRGYGNLIILKHDNVYLTAYAHNRTLLVKEDQSVIKGQKIAEMGSTDTDRVKLHFEVRRQGKPVDPSKYLPPR